MTTLRKNDLIDIDITGMTAQGAGVGHWEGMAVFTPLTAPAGWRSCSPPPRTGRSRTAPASPSAAAAATGTSAMRRS